MDPMSDRLEVGRKRLYHTHMVTHKHTHTHTLSRTSARTHAHTHTHNLSLVSLNGIKLD